MKFSVRYKIEFMLDVTQKEIKQLKNTLAKFGQESIFDIVVTKNSTDKEIAKFIAIENFCNAEATNVQDVEVLAVTKKKTLKEVTA